jgi:hypothetical protein
LLQQHPTGIIIAWFHSSLLSDGEVPAGALALMEIVMHHALAQQKEYYCQDNRKQELPHTE